MNSKDSRRLRIGITCFATFGGSGIVATEVGLAMAKRGHQVHFIARALPIRLDPTTENVFFHAVAEPDNAVLQPDGAYPIALASKMIEISQQFQLDLLHVHYAVPHATAAWLACQVLGKKAPKLVTTLHGTDITLVGNDATYLPITRFSVLKSDAVTVPSQFLREATYRELDLPRTMPIDVVQNFIDTEAWRPQQQRNREILRPHFSDLQSDEAILIHISNLRPLKRISDVVAIFQKVNAVRPTRLVLIGEGPQKQLAQNLLRQAGLEDRTAFLGHCDRVATYLGAADVFLLTSETESFGLAALEAMSCGIPVVSSDVGGLPEVVAHGETGFWAPMGDVAQMADYTLDLLGDAAKWQRFSARARQRVLSLFTAAPAVDAYEAVYRLVL